MWARKRPDIGWRDLAAATSYGLNPALTPPPASAIVQGWFPCQQALVCLSARSAFDLLLQALRLPKGSEVLFSAVTIPDMLQIIEHHGLSPVPVEVDSARLESSATNIKNAITSKSRLILVAHLFGTRTNMPPLLQLANQHQLLVVEDCAQAYQGDQFAGHPSSDIALFSFGPIKTATALGGAIARVKNPELLQKMSTIQHGYQQQSHGEFLTRVAKYASLKIASHPWLYGAIERTCNTFGISHDNLISTLGRNFSGPSLLQNIRRQPCAALQRLMVRRIQQFEANASRRLRRRTRIGRFLTRGIPDSTLHWTGHNNPSHTYWVLAACTTRARRLVRALRGARFDATMRSSLCNAPHAHQAKPKLKNWLQQTVFIPCDPDMPIQELRRLRRTIQKVFTSQPK